MDPIAEWIELAPKAAPLQEGKKWHVFLSYRSVHRSWVLQFYDILQQLGFKVFLDQFVLRANDNLVLALQRGLDDSASGILVWSSRTEDSKWCEKEYSTMEQKALTSGFHYGVAKLDAVELPLFAQGKLYADFSEYSEGPLGSGLLRLLYGILNKPLSDAAVRFGDRVDQEVREAKLSIQAALNAGSHTRLLELAKSNSVGWRSTPVLRCHVAESLIKLRRNDEALTVIEALEREFPSATRPRQLKGLALARSGRTEEAQLVLGELEAAGHRDPETLGIYARTWMDRYDRTGQRTFLRKSRNLYQLAFEHTPSDYYVGINAAAKSVMLDEPEVGKELAKHVQLLVGVAPRPGDYWGTATAAEAQLVQENYEVALKLYQAAVDMTPNEYGSHESTRRQARLLMKHLNTPAEVQARVEEVFAHLP